MDITKLGPISKLRYGGSYQLNPKTGIVEPKPAYLSKNGSQRMFISRTYRSNAVKRKKPVGLALLTSMTGHAAGKSIQTLSLNRDSLGNIWENDHPYASTVYVDGTTSYEASQQGILKVLAKVKDTKWNLSTFLGELPETYHYVASVAERLVSSYRAVKRGDMRSLHKIVLPPQWSQVNRRRVPRNTVTYTSGYGSGKWMEWRYAVQPMLYDVDDMLKYLYSSSLRPLISSAKATGRASNNVNIGDGSRTISCSETTQARYTIYYQVTPFISGMQKLGLLNPVQTLYELAPLSFVLDWFIPVGDYLASLDAMAGVSILGSCSSSRSISESTDTERFYPNFYGDITTTTPATTRNESYSRSGNAYLSPDLPQFEIGLNARRVIDGLSLLRLGLKDSK